MKKVLATFLTLIIGTCLFSVPVNADCVSQYGQYGQPCPSYSIIVDKMVGKPGTSNDATVYEYTDNLSLSNPRFKPDQIVFFKVKIKNTSSVKLVGVEAKDTVPLYLEPLEGPGNYNSASREVIWNAGDFEIDQEKIFYLKMKVLSQTNLPADKGLFCVNNFVKASTSSVYDDDTSQLCIEKQVLGTAKVPSAGPEMGILLFSGEIIALTVGLILKKKFS